MKNYIENNPIIPSPLAGEGQVGIDSYRGEGETQDEPQRLGTERIERIGDLSWF
jgi:hypothetical protein